jgi:phosphoheptose isomerase
LGEGGGGTAGLAEQEIIVPSDITSSALEVHTLIWHTWLNQGESEMWG